MYSIGGALAHADGASARRRRAARIVLVMGVSRQRLARLLYGLP
jgi:hypothetical protein